MQSIRRYLVILGFISALIFVLVSATVRAQTDINVSDRNLLRFGGDVTIAPNQVVENAAAIGGNVTLQPGARATEKAIAIGGDVILEKGAQVDGDAYAVGGDVITAEGAIVGGTSGTVAQDGRWGMHESRPHQDWFWPRYFFRTISHLLTVLFGAVVGVLILRWRPSFLLNLAAVVRQYPLESGLWGLGGTIAVIVLVILLAISLIGIPLLPLVGLAVAIAGLLGGLGVALWLGQQLLNDPDRTSVQQLLLGVLILGLIGLIPWLGSLVLFVVNLVGWGALLAWWLGKLRPQTV